MQGAGRVRAPNRSLPALALAFLLVLALSGALSSPAFAADDSNSGQLTPSPTVDPSALGAALTSLAQGTNDTQMQQLIAQFQSELSAGNYSAASSTLLQLQNAGSAQQNSPALNTLLNSLSVGSNGASINPNLLASILNAAQPGNSGEPPQRMSVDLQTLAGLMQYVNPTLASQLLQGSASLSQSAYGAGNAGGGKVSFPGISGLPGLSVPSIGTPSVPAGAGGIGLPSISPVALVGPILIVVSVAALFLSRKRLAGFLSATRLPGVPFGRGPGVQLAEPSVAPTDPRGKIEYYFVKAVRLMGRRGVPKTDSETHREFSSKVESRPEAPHVKTIVSLYEKAKFSGQSVGDPEADEAQSALRLIGEDEG